MGTPSTKLRDLKKTAARNATQISEDAGGVVAPDITPLRWRVASLTILAGAAFIRLYHLGLKPFHHDEGVNGFFLTNLYRTGVYQYNPENYHGPTLYYFALLTTKLNALLFGGSGLTTVAVRLVPVIFGVATVWLLLCLRRNIGAIGALCAAALIALSPGDVYISRYFIHEAHFVFFTLAIVLAAMRYYESADPLYLLLASLSAALLFATKETAIISVAVLSLALMVTSLYQRLARVSAGGGEGDVRSEQQRALKKRKSKKRPARREARLSRFGGLSNVALWSGVALALFIFTSILFYSSFFTYWDGVRGALESLQVWAKTGTKEHTHQLYTYLQWLIQEEAPLLLLGTTGAAIALIRRRNRFAIFAAAWAFGILAAYSLIPYKTPWLTINITVPLAIISGYALDEIYNLEEGLRSRVAALTLAALALLQSGAQSVLLNFYHYDDEQYPYVYAHTYRGFLPLVNKIDEVAARTEGAKTVITITAREYWPLPWYLRDYEHANFWGDLLDSRGQLIQVESPIVISSETQEMEQSDLLKRALGDRYQRVNTYPLRPGVTLVLYLKKELVEP